MSICPKNKSSKARRTEFAKLVVLTTKKKSLQWTNIHKSESVPMCNAAKGSRHRGLFCCLCGLSGSVI